MIRYTHIQLVGGTDNAGEDMQRFFVQQQFQFSVSAISGYRHGHAGAVGGFCFGAATVKGQFDELQRYPVEVGSIPFGCKGSLLYKRVKPSHADGVLRKGYWRFGKPFGGYGGDAAIGLSALQLHGTVIGRHLHGVAAHAFEHFQHQRLEHNASACLYVLAGNAAGDLIADVGAGKGDGAGVCIGLQQYTAQFHNVLMRCCHLKGGLHGA